MAIRTEVQVKINSRNDRELPPTNGTLKLVEWTKQERVKNAFKTFGIFFGLTCCGVMLPIIHYFLVPILFVTTFVMAMDKYTQLKYIEGGQGPCPRCNHEIIFEKSKYKERLTDSCGKCHDDIEILM